MDVVRIGCIVEGHGETQAVPLLIRRIAGYIDPVLQLEVVPPIREPKSKLLRAGELERAVELVARTTGGHGAVLVLLDSDDDCPAITGPTLLHRARQARPDLPVAVVLAKCEFESWFLAAAESLRGQRGLPADLRAPPDPESVRGAKEWLSRRMPAGQSYRETLDQPALAARFNLDAARRADSFDKCFREIARLLAAQMGGGA
jgi:hypothetical protein